MRRPEATARRWVVPFEEGSRGMRELLGGKGANVAEMTRVLGPDRVPAGFTITTEACVAYLDGGGTEPAGLAEEVAAALEALEGRAGRRLGDPADPLLVSVRSGARESMPGMLDTVLNLGLNDAAVEGLAATTGNERFAWDSYRRFTQMFGNVARGVPGERYEAELRAARERRGVEHDTGLTAGDLRDLVRRFLALYEEETGEPFPQEPREQLRLAVRAVFDSWNGARAVAYRRLNGIPDAWGTAVNVQQMVFGNKGETSGSGVAFSRDELTGAPEPSGDFLPNAQGEDVVAGVRNTRDIAEMADLMPEAHAELLRILRTLERHYGDMQDTEFTVEEGRLYMLQTRAAKRPAQAAVRFAVDAVAEGLLDEDAALLTIDASSLEALLHPTFDPSAEPEIVATGVNASPGAAVGEIVLSADEAVAAAAEDPPRDVVLVRPFTEADDVVGFHAARGILTSEGGKASHAALVARGMGRPCVSGASAVRVDLEARTVTIGERVLHPGDRIAIDGTTGRVSLDDVPLVEPEPSPEFERVMVWADARRTLRVRANADTPEVAARAREHGAEGIGLMRSEHMFLGTARQDLMTDVILALDDEDERRGALARLVPFQREVFAGVLAAMDGLPVTVRLLDPPLHEFLPNPRDVAEHLADPDLPAEQRRRLERVQDRREALHESNPMLGLRGCRLGVVDPDIYRAQVRALLEAFVEVREAGRTPALEVMVPLVAYEQELREVRALIEAEAAALDLVPGEDLLIGTMLELPRACLQADRIAEDADFFSFGTNDLTQTALGFSRDDVDKRITQRYLDRGIFDRSPFETLDTPGVGQLVRMGAWLGRSAKGSLKLGVCGDHGGDPVSIDFFHHSGIDYVSCPPSSVPIARLAAAQAAVRAARSAS